MSAGGDSDPVVTARPACLIFGLPKSAEDAYRQLETTLPERIKMMSRLGYSYIIKPGQGRGDSFIIIRRGDTDLLRFEKDVKQGRQAVYHARYFSTSSQRWIPFSPKEDTDCWKTFLGERSEDIFEYKMLFGGVRVFP